MDKTVTDLIEDRYNRLKNGKRRPSLEYVSPQEIKETFLPYIKNKEFFNNLSDKELLDFYQKWYEQNRDPQNGNSFSSFQDSAKETLDLPDLN